MIAYDKTKVYDLLRKEFADSEVEIALVIELDGNGEIAQVRKTTGVQSEVSFDMSVMNKTTPMILAHCHPTDAATPSTGDRRVVMHMAYKGFNLVDVLLYSNFLGTERIFSWLDSGTLEADTEQAKIIMPLRMEALLFGSKSADAKLQAGLLEVRRQRRVPTTG